MPDCKTFLLAALIGLETVAPPMDSAAAGAQVYQNGLPPDPSYFPIGVWLQPPRLAPEYKAIGVNLFVKLWQGPTEAQLAELARYDMRVLVAQNDVGLKSRYARMIRGWLLNEDEPDNAQPSASGGWGPCMPAKDVAAETRALKRNDPTRPVVGGSTAGCHCRSGSRRGLRPGCPGKPTRFPGRRLVRHIAVCEPNSTVLPRSAPEIARESLPAKFRFPDLHARRRRRRSRHGRDPRHPRRRSPDQRGARLETSPVDRRRRSGLLNPAAARSFPGLRRPGSRSPLPGCGR